MNWLEKTFEVMLPHLKVATQDYAEYIDYDNTPTFVVKEDEQRFVMGRCHREPKKGEWDKFDFTISVGPDDDTKLMIAVLLHELIHWMCDQLEYSYKKYHESIGHRGEFIIIGKRFGMKAPWSYTSREDSNMNPFINMIYEQVGDYED